MVADQHSVKYLQMLLALWPWVLSIALILGLVASTSRGMVMPFGMVGGAVVWAIGLLAGSERRPANRTLDQRFHIYRAYALCGVGIFALCLCLFALGEWLYNPAWR